MRVENIEKIGALIEPMLRAARVPGAAVAVVANGEIIFSSGYGFRDLAAKKPMSSRTVYPIASTTKAMNATLLGMLVDDGKLAWDVPIRQYWPDFELMDVEATRRVTLRDMLSMRTGLPRHDWVWLGNDIGRGELGQILRFLEPAAGFRERFQYNNILVTATGHVAELVTHESWEALMKKRLLEPLGMTTTGFQRPQVDDVTNSYFESHERTLKPTVYLASDATGPSGGTIYSTVEDMAKWIVFNLSGGKASGRQLIKESTLAHLQCPHVMIGTDPASPSPNAAYAFGWFVDVYNGFGRVSHGGYLNDVNSDVMLIPREKLGFVSFSNFGPPAIARLMNEHMFDLLMDRTPVQSIEEKLSLYEKRIEEARQRVGTVRRVAQTAPSHSLADYVGKYQHAGYGCIEIILDGDALYAKRGQLLLPLEHWHYDAWVVRQAGQFAIHGPHAFDTASRWLFQSDADGQVDTLLVQLEPAIAPIRFVRTQPSG